MDQMTHHVAPSFMWPTVGHPGRVPLWALAPNPNQPRTEAGLDDAELDSLAYTMKPENGGELREILTVREVYESERSQYPAEVRYVIISGERRWRSAKRAGLTDIEIRVKRYKSVADEEFDMYMLNEKRVGLSDIENARYLARIMKNFGLKTQDELATKVGKKQSEVSQLLALLKLSPKAQAQMSPKVPEYARIKRQVGVFLSRLTFEVQDDFIERMPKERATAGQQIHWMQTELKDKAVELPTKLSGPADLRDIFSYFADQVKRRAGELLAKQNIHRLFENVKDGQVDKLLENLLDAEEEFDNLLERVRSLARTATETPARSDTTPKPAPVRTPSPAAPKPAATPMPPAVSHEPLIKRVHEQGQQLAQARTGNGAVNPAPVVTHKSSASPNEMGLGLPPKTPPLSYYDKRKGGWVRGATIDWNRYMDLWREKNLEFQFLEREKPEDLPTLEEVREKFTRLRTKADG